MASEHEDQLERRRDELRRIVYGTRGDVDPDAEVELAEVEAAMAARARAAEPAASDAPIAKPMRDEPAEPAEATEGIGPTATTTATADAQELPTEEPPPRRRPTRSQLLAAVVAVLVLVAVGIGLLGPVREALSPARGLEVFERDPTPDDLDRVDQVATGARLDPDEAETLRSLGRAFGYAFWVFRDDSRVCLLTQREFFFQWTETCATLQEFQSHGLTRRIAADDIRDGARPRRIGPGDVVVVTWGPESTEIEWTVQP